MTIIRFLLAPILGLVVFIFTVSGVERFGQWMYPPSPEVAELATQLTAAVKVQDQAALLEIKPKLDAAMSTYFNSAPVGALLFVVFAWIASAFFGGLVAAKVSPVLKVQMAIFIGFIDVMGIVMVTLQIKYPIWMPIVGIVGALAMSWFAGMRVAGRDHRIKEAVEA